MPKPPTSPSPVGDCITEKLEELAQLVKDDGVAAGITFLADRGFKDDQQPPAPFRSRSFTCPVARYLRTACNTEHLNIGTNTVFYVETTADGPEPMNKSVPKYVSRLIIYIDDNQEHQ